MTVAIAVACSLTVSAGAQSRRAMKNPALIPKVAVDAPECHSLMVDYEAASKKLALSDAEDILDNSAARSTMRETQNGNVINQARMTLDLMKGSGCKLPTFVPSGSRYGAASLSCTAAKQRIRTQVAMDRLRDQVKFYDPPAECDTATWKPDAP